MAEKYPSYLQPDTKIRNPFGFIYTVARQEGDQVWIREFAIGAPMYYLLRSKCEIVENQKTKKGAKSK
jgi:hypothetical protein